MAGKQKKGIDMPLINKYAMHYGLLLGAFWVFRYIFLIVGGAGVSDRFIFLFYLLNIGTMLLIYMFFYKFKTAETDTPKTAWACILFTILLCFYGSFLEGAIMYAHFKFIDPAYFSQMIVPYLKAVETTPNMGFVSEKDFQDAKLIMEEMYSSKITYVVIEFIKNMFLGLFLGVLLNFVVNIRKSN